MLTVIATARAQHDVGTWTVTPKVGMNLAMMTEDNVDYQSLDGVVEGPLDSKMTVSFVAGAEGEYQLHKMVALGAGLLYSRQGMDYKHDGLSSTTKLDYLNVPLTANVYVAKNLALKTGVQLGFCVGKHGAAESQLFPHGDNYLTYHTSHPVWSSGDFYRSFDLSIPLGVSYDYKNFRADLRYNFGLIDQSNDGFKMMNRVVQLTIGYSFEVYY